MRHHIRGFLGIVFALLLIFITFVTSFEAVTYWTPNFYREEFEQYHVLDDMEYWMGDEMTMDDLCEVMHQTMVYLRGDRENLIVETNINGETTEFYNQNEKSHMADVRDLFVICIVVRALAILTCLAIAGFLIVVAGLSGALHYLSRGFIRACLLILGLVGIIGILAAINFTKVFTVFHEIFFSQGNWMFDPRESRMINMLPEGFFSDCALRIAITFVRAMLVLLAVAIFERIQPLLAAGGLWKHVRKS